MTAKGLSPHSLGDTPHPRRRIDNLNAIADDPSVNNFARAVCREAAIHLKRVAEESASIGVGAIVCRTGGMNEGKT